jgi:hypothetical protein
MDNFPEHSDPEYFKTENIIGNYLIRYCDSDHEIPYSWWKTLNKNI